jgi:hypothetical protein
MTLANLQTAFARALADPALPVPEGIVAAGGRVDPVRFAVYRNNVAVALAGALAARFRVTELLVGAEFFAAMASLYCARHRPASPLMARYGDGFPDFIAGFPPATELPYLPDLARLEALWSRAYNAAEAEPLDVAGLAAIRPEALAQARLMPHPATGLLRSAHPVGSIWQAHQDAEVAPLADWRPETVLVVRPGAEVRLHVLPPGDGVFAAHLLAGAALEAAAREALAVDSSFDFGSALVGLVGLGAFTSMTEGSEP